MRAPVHMRLFLHGLIVFSEKINKSNDQCLCLKPNINSYVMSGVSRHFFFFTCVDSVRRSRQEVI